MSTPTPTFKQVARRPRWIGVLALCLLVAAVFALLGQWQIDRAVEQGQADERDTETAVPLRSVATPGEPMLSDAGGRMVTVSGDDVAADYRTLAGRNQDGRLGWWVIGRVLVAEPDGRDASLAVALSWSATQERADAAVEALRADAATVGQAELGGRYMPTEAPTQGDVREREREAMSVAALINEWQDWNGLVYSGYLVFDPTVVAEGGATVPGDEPIVHERPVTDTQLNWLNVFYAVEWVAFMVFAFYLWYRLVKDALEREVEAIEDAEAAAV
ncbi:SURF1 family cytochrome oxidase biogenesis protein [Agrococcus sp. Marseille-P2731]|uniref:SURF1 family cytochrome oxidase biogenesis protein n=1 Tax=Agrococcus sp. Marseille-P2731 TaxID=1841862 RepID=UPI00092FF055|nr:SURF1 family cytochrome oxidase biogenesis protein [Agrococcus sp. Marseille-P2731]